MNIYPPAWLFFTC